MSAIHLDGRDPQTVLDEVGPFTTVHADPGREISIQAPLTVDTPGLRLVGFTLRLADNANENLVEITADDVRFSNFRLDGNRKNQSSDHTDSGITVSNASGVTITSGIISNVDRHAVLVGPGSLSYESDQKRRILRETQVTDTTVRDVRVINPGRDGCSIQGVGVATVTVDNVRTIGAEQRGAVEVKDGASGVIVTNCYAEESAYGCAIQDHRDFGTRDVVFANNLAESCTKLIDTQTSVRHERAMIVNNVGRDITGTADLTVPAGIHTSLIDGLLIGGNTLETVGTTGIDVRECSNVQVVTNAVSDVADGPGISIADTSGVVTANNLVTDTAADGVLCISTTESGIEDIQICNNVCRGCSGSGIRLSEETGTINYYLVAHNIARGTNVDTVDDVTGSSGLCTDNITDSS